MYYGLLEICNLPRRTWLQITKIFFYYFPPFLKMFWVCLLHQKGMRLLFEGLALENRKAAEIMWQRSWARANGLFTFTWLIISVTVFFCPARLILFFWVILWGYNFWQLTNYLDYFWRLKIKWQMQICTKPADILMGHYLAWSSLWVDFQNLVEICKNSCITLNK